MVDKNMLRAAFVAQGFNDSTFADAIGVSRQSFSYKINGRRNFTSNEVSIIAHILKLTPEQVMKIFFDRNVEE